MLNLMQNGQVVGVAIEGGWARLPNGTMISPAVAGWSSGGFSLVQVVDTPVYVPPSGVTSDLVNFERDRRMRGTFGFLGKQFDCDETSLQRMTGAASLAGFWIASGGDPNSLLWHGGPTPFVWISHDNTENQMSAATVFALGKAAAHNETLHIFAARALKNMNPIPEDYASNIYWP